MRSMKKVFLTLEPETVRRIDSLVERRSFLDRSHAVEAALREKFANLATGRLARECAKLDPIEERAFADQGFASGVVPRWGC